MAKGTRKTGKNFKEKLRDVLRDPATLFGGAGLSMAIPGGIIPIIFTMIESTIAIGVAAYREFSPSAKNSSFLKKHAGSPMIAEGLSLLAASIYYLDRGIRTQQPYALNMGIAYFNWAAYTITKGGQINGWKPKKFPNMFAPDNSRNFFWRDMFGRAEFYSAAAVLALSSYMITTMGTPALLWTGLGLGMMALVVTDSKVNPHHRAVQIKNSFNRIAGNKNLPRLLRKQTQKVADKGLYMSNNFIARGISCAFQYTAGATMLSVGMMQMWAQKTFVPNENVYFGVGNFLAGFGIVEVLKHDIRRENPYQSLDPLIETSKKTGTAAPEIRLPEMTLNGKTVDFSLRHDFVPAGKMKCVKPESPALTEIERYKGQAYLIPA
ncbi:MAG: hypothetical protein H6868_02485 [Rhodospirillales bacterium]|nr:hypothetical protein [Rhodospirillales bacterium]